MDHIKGAVSLKFHRGNYSFGADPEVSRLDAPPGWGASSDGRYGFSGKVGFSENKTMDLRIPNSFDLIDISEDQDAWRIFAEATGESEAYLKRFYRARRYKLDIPLADPSVSKELAGSLLSEAVACRHGTIPTAAFVEIWAPPFLGVHVMELKDAVYFFWITTGDPKIFFCRVLLSGQDFKWQILTDGLAALRRRLKAAAIIGGAPPIFPKEALDVQSLSEACEADLAALYLMSAAILRDFWVVEDRSLADRLGAPRVRVPRGMKDGARTVIYLPRCRYDRSAIIAATCAGDKRWTISPHFIRSHIRQLPEGSHATVKQQAIARLHGVDIPEGKTWVRGHVAAAGTEDAKRYRSRSAVRSLMQVLDVTKPKEALTGLTWYAFERLCEAMLKRRGYEVLDKVGDGGIDILAIDRNGGYLFAQAKHWSKKVGPGVVREMIGSLTARRADISKDAKGCVISSSGFTEAAIAEAADAGIDLITVLEGAA